MELSQIIEKVKLTTNDPKSRYYDVTEDWVFCDTYEDVKNINSEERIAYNTDYAVMNKGFLTRTSRGYKDKRTTCYWLRSAAAPVVLVVSM